MTVVVRQHQCCWRHHAWSTDVNTAAIARTVTACLVPRDYSGSAVYVEGAGLASREVVSYAELCGRLLSVSCASSIEVGTLIFFFFSCFSMISCFSSGDIRAVAVTGIFISPFLNQTIGSIAYSLYSQDKCLSRYTGYTS